MILLSVNDVLQVPESEDSFRILWIDEGNIIAYLIDINDEKAVPFVQTTAEIRQQIVSDELLKVRDIDINRHIISNLTDKQEEHRNKAWKMIEELVDLEPDIYQRKKRGKIVRKFIDEHGFNRVTLYKNLRRYWQRGKTKDALIPDYSNSGGKGKDKNLSDNKVGKPREYNSNGINVDSKTKGIFKEAINRHYLSAKKNSLSHAYRMMIKENYTEDYYYEDGVQKIILRNEDKVPSERQFRYWFKKEYGVKEIVTRREGSKKYERDHRPVLGSSTHEVFGPGSRFQIDATIADVYLVSSYNADWIIGRPIIYFVIDVFSRMITGMYIGLEGPSWVGAMMALENTTKNKVEYCKEFGINIAESQWACEHLPEVILADNGEFEGYLVEPLINGLKVNVENHPSFRPDWKGIVEKLFDTSQKHLKPFLPGYIDKDFRERGAEDYRLKAKLTMQDYTKLIIQFVIHYNNNHYMDAYVRDEEMIEAGVKSTPRELWNWGLINRAGKLKTAPANVIRFYLMPTTKATVTHKGIKFKNMLYSCESAVKESWFALARPGQKGTWKVNVSYDSRNVSKIYLHSEQSIYETCYLLDHQERYKDKTLEEVTDLQKREKNNYKEQKHVSLEQDVNFINGIEAIAKSAVKEANKKQTPISKISKKKKTEDIRSNRALEKEANRKTEVFDLDVSDTKELEVQNKKVTAITDRQQDEVENYELPSVRNLFKKRKGAN